MKMAGVGASDALASKKYIACFDEIYSIILNKYKKWCVDMLEFNLEINHPHPCMFSVHIIQITLFHAC